MPQERAMRLRPPPIVFSAVAVLAACSSMQREGTSATASGAPMEGGASGTAATAPAGAPATRAAQADAAAAAVGRATPVDAQMQQVLNELQALGAKPVHSLS